LRTASTKETSASGSYITNVGTLTMNGTIAPYLYPSYQPTEGDELRLWVNVASLKGTPQFDLPTIHECSKDERIYEIVWDTSDIAQGVLRIASVKDVTTGIQTVEVADDELVEVQVFTLNGELVCSFYSPLKSVNTAFRNTATTKGVYLLKMKTEAGKTLSRKVLK